MFLAASLETMRVRICDGPMFSFSTIYAIFAVMVVVLPEPARISWGRECRVRVRCAEKKIHYGTGFEQAINTWLIACAGDDLLSQPSFNTINPNVINEFRSRCKRHRFDILSGITASTWC